jgi:hypothetical protein
LKKHGASEALLGDKDPIPYLIDLYACEDDAVKELAKCRVNPNFDNPIRNDLEFFIPQLCTFYIQEGLITPEIVA